MDYLVFILPALIAIYWIVRIFVSDDVCSVQLLMLGGIMTMVLSMFFPEQVSILIFPFIFLAIRQKISAVGLRKWDWLILVPSFILLPFGHETVYHILLFIQVIAITVWGIISLHIYDRKVAELYDSSSDFSSDNINMAVKFSFFTFILCAILHLLPEQMLSNLLIMTLFSLFLAILQFYIGYNVFRIKEYANVAAEVEKMEVSENIVEESVTCPDQSDNLNQTIQHIINDKLFLDPSISLVSMAEMLHTNRTYLSRSIHEQSGKNFSDFINSLRINYFIEIVKEKGKNVNIKEAAISSGYSSIQSFYRNFSEMMDMTPKTWISRNIHE